MLEKQDAMMVVRAELCEKLEALRRFRRPSQRDVTAAIGQMRQLAASYGLIPVVRLADALERAVAEQPTRSCRCPTALYLDRLQDAIGCTHYDERTSEALLASVSVRLGA